MLFDKKIEPRCVYCAHFLPVGEENGFCEKKGPASPFGKCRSFRYDPLKRVPPKNLAEDELPVFDDPEEEGGSSRE